MVPPLQAWFPNNNFVGNVVAIQEILDANAMDLRTKYAKPWAAYILWKITDDARRMFSAQPTKADIDHGDKWTKSKLDGLASMLDSDLLMANEAQIPREWLPKPTRQQQQQLFQQQQQTATTNANFAGANTGKGKRPGPAAPRAWVKYEHRHPTIASVWDPFVEKHKHRHRSITRVTTVLKAAGLPKNTFMEEGFTARECLSCQIRNEHPDPCDNDHSFLERPMPDDKALSVANKLKKGINAINANPDRYVEEDKPKKPRRF